MDKAKFLDWIRVWSYDTHDHAGREQLAIDLGKYDPKVSELWRNLVKVQNELHEYCGSKIEK